MRDKKIQMGIFQSLFSIFKSNKKLSEKNESDLFRAKEIAGHGNYEVVKMDLLGAGLLDKYRETVEEKYAAAIRRAEFSPVPEDWEMLAILWLYDVPTADHCVRTLGLAHDISTKKMKGPAGEKIVLRKLVEKQMLFQQFLRAALFHDIGKIALPREIINNTLSDRELGELFMDMLRHEDRDKILLSIGLDPSEISDCENALKKLYDHGLRPKDVLPVREIFTGNTGDVLAVIEKNGFSTEETLGGIISRHESEGAKIFAPIDPIVGEIIGRHHPGVRLACKKTPRALKEANEYIKKYIVHFMLAVVDEYDAISHHRDYKKAVRKAEVLSILARETQSGRLEKGLTYLWVKEQYHKLKKVSEDKKFHIITEDFLSKEKNKDAVRILEGLMK